MTTDEKEMNRLEMQIEQLITIVANLNDRLLKIEELERMRQRHGFRTTTIAREI